MSKQTAMCPSSPWNSEGARVFGVVGGEVQQPKVFFLKQMLAPSKELENKLNGALPEEVFRVAAPCAGSACGHHDDSTQKCSLVQKIVVGVEPVVDAYAVCLIRSSCVWWAQEGVKACVRCPSIATRNRLPGEQIALAANPKTSVESYQSAAKPQA